MAYNSSAVAHQCQCQCRRQFQCRRQCQCRRQFQCQCQCRRQCQCNQSGPLARPIVKLVSKHGAPAGKATSTVVRGAYGDLEFYLAGMGITTLVETDTAMPGTPAWTSHDPIDPENVARLLVTGHKANSIAHFVLHTRDAEFHSVTGSVTSFKVYNIVLIGL
jgi:hypothetical protein